MSYLYNPLFSIVPTGLYGSFYLKQAMNCLPIGVCPYGAYIVIRNVFCLSCHFFHRCYCFIPLLFRLVRVIVLLCKNFFSPFPAPRFHEDKFREDEFHEDKFCKFSSRPSYYNPSTSCFFMLVFQNAQL